MRAGKGLLYGLGSLSIGFGVYQGISPSDSGILRFGRAAVTVAQIGLDYKKTLNSSSNLDLESYAALKSQTHLRSAERLLSLCCQNGGCFIKVGQHIGALEYLLPEEYVSTLKILHSQAPEIPLSDVRAVLKEDLSKDPEELFLEFDEKPLGTASLAQVHRAVLKDGREVAVKVQRRYVKQNSLVDIYTMDFLVRVVKTIFPQFEFMWIAQEMKKNLPMELSFQQEGMNAERISNLLPFDWLRVPEIFWEYTTDRVLVMEYFSGGHINDIEYMRINGIDTYDVSKKIGRMYADMIFKHGYVHCDPHPGNVLVKKNDSGKADIILLDHGLYTQLSNQFRIDYASFWLSILDADVEGIKRSADALGVGRLSELFACMVTGRSWNSIKEGIDKSKKTSKEGQEVKDNAAQYIREIADVLAYVNRQMILIFKTNDLLRTIEHNLKTTNSMHSFVQMSRACVRSLNFHRVRKCRSAFCRFKLYLNGNWEQLKISFYHAFLWIYLSLK